MSDPQTPDSPVPEGAPVETTAPEPAPVEAVMKSPVSEEPRPHTKPTPPPKASSGTGLALLALLVACGAGAGVGYYVMQNQAQQARLEAIAADYATLQGLREENAAEFERLRQSRDQLEQDLRAQLQQLQSAQSTQNAQAEALNRELAALRARLNEGGESAGNTLRSMEASALLSLAQERLLLAADVRSAISLMQGADAVLRQSDDAAMFTVREALAQDLAELQMVEEVDVAGLYARLGAASARVAELTVQPGGELPDFRVEPASDPAAPRSWWEETLDYLNRYFVITRDTVDAVPIIAQDQTWLIEERLRLQLEAARVALLQGRRDVYQRALDDAIGGIDRLMQGEGKAALLTELRELRASPIQTAVPPASRALDALRRLQPAERTIP